MPSEDLLKDLVREIVDRTEKFNNDEDINVGTGINQAGLIVAKAVLDFLDGKPEGLNILAGRGK